MSASPAWAIALPLPHFLLHIQTAALSQNLGKTRALIRSSSTNGFHKIYRWISLIVEADDGVAEITDFKKTVHYVRL